MIAGLLSRRRSLTGPSSFRPFPLRPPSQYRRRPTSNRRFARKPVTTRPRSTELNILGIPPAGTNIFTNCATQPCRQATNLLRHSSTIQELKQPTPIAVYRKDNRCSRGPQKCKTCPGRKHSEAARAGSALESGDFGRNAVQRPPNPHRPLEQRPRQCPVQNPPPQ